MVLSICARKPAVDFNPLGSLKTNQQYVHGQNSKPSLKQLNRYYQLEKMRGTEMALTDALTECGYKGSVAQEILF